MCTIARFEVKDYIRRQHDFRFAFDASLIDRIADMQVTDSDYFEARARRSRDLLGQIGFQPTCSVEFTIRTERVG